MPLPPTRPRSLSTGTQPAPAPTPATPDFRCWARFERSAIYPYMGEFGFDWMDWQRFSPHVTPETHPLSFDPLASIANDLTPRSPTRLTGVMGVPIENLEYCYDQRQHRFVPVAEDTYLRHRLQDEYQRLVIYGEDYFAAWLSMWPNQEIRLHLRIEALNSAPAKGDYLTFEPNPAYEVTYYGQVNEAIRIDLYGGDSNAEITVRCLRPSTRTSLRVRDEHGVLVGQLNVVDNTKKYHLPIRVVYLVKEEPAAATQVAKLQQSFAAMNLEFYLNRTIFNQALIEISFEKTNQLYQIRFKETDWADRYYDSKHHSLMDGVAIEKGSNEVKFYQVLEKAQQEYITKYEKATSGSFRGILLILTNIPKKSSIGKVFGEGGFSPLDFRSVLVYGDGLTERITYKHEIGHVLGLEHSFYDSAFYEVELNTLINLKLTKEQEILDYQKLLNSNEQKIKNRPLFYSMNPEIAKRDYTKSILYKDKINEIKNQITYINEDIRATSKKTYESRKGTAVSYNNKYKFTKLSTQNVMDYREDTESFFHWQWSVMQSDIAKYYGKVQQTNY